MKSVLLILVLQLILACTVAEATATVESPENCKQCGMDRLAFARSRMLVVYGDGTNAGLCSLHCAAAELQTTTDKQVTSIMVADYYSKELLDAKTAVWVVGGRERGVMTSLAKWAFSGIESVRRFIEMNGGVVNSFEQAMKLATAEVMEQIAEANSVENEFLKELR